ncbi:hypothetical protein IU459_33445 [Nocardia amamiensis]|uniref:PPE family domain-containing protein n=1 Tax=Nocardia amamiensis TaxID=404578 RepID=A0ABS0D0Q5_9NOCA|nr:hypothetical protein [Nocardia amamiensis]MBF6302409.1 hypothetical protein [Nocardia amamiensis]
MALDSDVSDNTKWASLANAELLLEAGTAQKCAQHVEDMLNVVVGVHTWVQGNYERASPVFAACVSGVQMWALFNSKIATELLERMDRHRNILTNMGNTFLAAGKKYDLTEHNSAVSFEGISFDSPPGTPPSGAPKSVKIPRHSNKPDTTTLYDPALFWPEAGSQLDWSVLYNVGQSINAQAVADAGGVWYWLSKGLDRGFDTLRTTIAGASDQWTGAGADAAILATTQYVLASEQLTTDMNLLGDSLVFSSGWLQQTKNGMPQTPEPPPATTTSQQTQNDADLLRFQEHFQTHYTENYMHLTTHIVALPQPNEVVAPSLDVGGTAPTPIDALDTPGADGSGGDSGDEPPTGPANNGGDAPPVGDTPTGGDNPPVDGDDPSSGLPNPEPETGPNTPNLPEGLEDKPFETLSNLSDDLTSEKSGSTPWLMNSALLPPGNVPFVGKGGGGGGGTGRVFALEQLKNQEAKLFPRLTAVPDEKLPGRAGPAGGREPGVPFGGHPGRPNGEEKEKKRSELLDSTEHLDEALGQHGRGIRPVLDR